MINFKITTEVEQDYETVFERFDDKLFLALKPPFLPLTLNRFDGCEVGNEVHLTLGVGILSQDWNALIIEKKETDNEIYFIDTGSKLPFFLQFWKHRHRIIRHKNGGTTIIDDITYGAPHFLFNYILYPFLYIQFWMRKSVYRKYFKL